MPDLVDENGVVYATFFREATPQEDCPKCKFTNDKYVVIGRDIYKRVTPLTY